MVSLADILRHWVSTWRKGLTQPAAPERIVADPCLADVKLIAEAWDAAGLYQVGNFPAYGRWAEWNGKFRDDIRRFVKGDADMVPKLAARLTGSADLYQSSARKPYHSINFVTCHDGFTLRDLVSYQQKHNEENGEGNRDGSSENLSWNCGAEGATTDQEIERLRRRHIRNIATLLMMAHGVPMILYGDEVGRTQSGNNNAYCQDNELTWMNWNVNHEQRDLFRFFKNLIQFRRSHPALRRDCFESLFKAEQVEMVWHGRRLFQADWSPESRSLALHLRLRGERAAEDNIFIIANTYWEDSQFELPPLQGRAWARFLDTALEPPQDICEIGGEKQLEGVESYSVGARSVVVLVGGPPTR